jgi:hypothetical protein
MDSSGTPALELVPWDPKPQRRLRAVRASGLHEILAPWMGEAPQLATATEFDVVDLVTQHDVEAHEQLPGDGDFRFRPSVPIQHGTVQTFEIGIGADGDVAGLAKHEAEQRVPLLRDVAQPVLVGRRVHSTVGHRQRLSVLKNEFCPEPFIEIYHLSYFCNGNYLATRQIPRFFVTVKVGGTELNLSRNM